MARAVYSEADKARAYVVLATNAGNIKRTVRHTGVPEGTLRGWIKSWEENGPPDTGEVEVSAGEFLTDAERVRDLALAQLEKKIKSGEGSVNQLSTVVGTLQDKIALAKGLATSRTETVHQLPPADEIREALKSAMAGVLEAAHQREHELIEADVVEQAPPRALTRGTT